MIAPDKSQVFDVVGHHRARTRRAEAHADSAERQRDKLERLLILALDVATGNGERCDRLVLLGLLEELDEALQRPCIDEERVLELLRRAA